MLCPTTQPSPYDYAPPHSDVTEELEAINELRNEIFDANLKIIAKATISPAIKKDFLQYLIEAIDETIKLQCVNALHIGTCDLREEAFEAIEWVDLKAKIITDEWVIV
jgi:hypothetical protein